MEKNAGQIIEVVFENGVLKPSDPVRVLNEHEKGLVYLYPATPSANLSSFYGSLTKEEGEEIEKIIEGEFERVEGDW